MASYLRIIYVSKKLYNETLEEIQSLGEKCSFVISRSYHYHTQISLQSENKEKMREYVRKCDELVKIVDEKIRILYHQLEKAILEHDKTVEFLKKEKCINIDSLASKHSCGGCGGSSESTAENPERNSLFQKMLDEMDQDIEDQSSLEDQSSAEEEWQDIDAI